MRLFTAILFPEHVKEQLLCLQNLLRAQGSGSFTQCDNLHLTLSFLGETPHEAEAIAALCATQAVPFTLRFTTLGNFGNLYWAGCEKSSPLLDLQQSGVDALGSQGFNLEKRPFLPHVTLCRNYQLHGTVPSLQIEALLEKITFRVDSISLMESTRCSGQLLYRERYRKKLQ